MAPVTNSNLPSGLSYEERIVPGVSQSLSQSISVVDLTTVAGIGKIKYTSADAAIERRLYRIHGSSIKWIAVVLPKKLFLEPIPLIFFMPQPGNNELLKSGDLNDFKGAWPALYDDYTYYMGNQVAAASPQTALIVPYYLDNQVQKLGSFNDHWQPLIREVLTDALMKKDPLIVRADQTSFKKIMTCGYSSGVVVHKHFHAKGVNVEAMTTRLYSLDGKIGGSHWENWSFAGAVVYKDLEAKMPNPRGTVYHLAGRWWSSDWATQQAEKAKMNLRAATSHWMPAQFMLYHGLKMHPPA